MKKILQSIIISSFIISSIFSANATEWYIEQIFDLNKGIEVYELELSSLENLNFKNSAIQATYDEFKRVDTVLKDEFIRQYRTWDISYYEMQDLVQDYNNFVYYTSKTFSYISQEEKGFRGRETERAIYNGYSNMRQSYAKVKAIITK